jgi:hypothetical protein
MSRMRVGHRCDSCRHYWKEGISHRCTLTSNTYTTWLGMTYVEHPDQKNMRGRCEDYENEKANSDCDTV